MVPSAKPEPVQLMPAKVPNARKGANDAAWESAFASLLEFHRRHGHFQVPKDAEHLRLHYWAAHQRVRLSRDAMLPERRERLQAAGFPGESHLLQRRTGDRIWDRHFDELMNFRRVHGHFNILGPDANYKALKEWVNTQRRKHNSGRLRPDRHRCLEAFGFPWSAAGLNWKSKWKLRFTELTAYRQRFGHCRVPTDWPENPALARWVSSQRFRRKSGKLSPEHRARLDHLGFEWKLMRCSDEAWNARFAELAAFQKRFGHCLVPKHWPDSPALARWVDGERRRYSHTRQTQPERIDQLDAIHFVWAGGWSTLGRCWRKKRLAFMNGMVREPHPPGGV